VDEGKPLLGGGRPSGGAGGGGVGAAGAGGAGAAGGGGGDRARAPHGPGGSRTLRMELCGLAPGGVLQDQDLHDAREVALAAAAAAAARDPALHPPEATCDASTGHPATPTGRPATGHGGPTGRPASPPGSGSDKRWHMAWPWQRRSAAAWRCSTGDGVTVAAAAANGSVTGGGLISGGVTVVACEAGRSAGGDVTATAAAAAAAASEARPWNAVPAPAELPASRFCPSLENHWQL